MSGAALAALREVELLDDLPGAGNVGLGLLVFAGVALAGLEVAAAVEDYVLGAHVAVMEEGSG